MCMSIYDIEENIGACGCFTHGKRLKGCRYWDVNVERAKKKLRLQHITSMIRLKFFSCSVSDLCEKTHGLEDLAASNGTKLFIYSSEDEITEGFPGNM